MKKSVLIISILILIIAFSACSKQCAEEGESIGTCVGCISTCCEGLKPMFNLKYDEGCMDVPGPGSGGICSDCGNDVCDTENSEDECNCPEDCASLAKDNNISTLPDYYKELAEACQDKPSVGCCMSSVNNMKAGNYTLIPGETLAEHGCGEGFIGNTLRCEDSYKWCEPVDYGIQCNEGDACAYSMNHPSGEYTCVRKDWQNEWDQNPESINYLTDCEAGYICTDPFNCGDISQDNLCECVNNKCQKADITEYGWEWTDSDC